MIRTSEQRVWSVARHLVATPLVVPDRSPMIPAVTARARSTCASDPWGPKRGSRDWSPGPWPWVGARVLANAEAWYASRSYRRELLRRRHFRRRLRDGGVPRQLAGESPRRRVFGLLHPA